MSGTVTIEPASALSGVAKVPGDKSISHRALLLSALAEGRSQIEGLSDGDDVRRTGLVISKLGAEVATGAAHVVVEGGRSRLSASGDLLDFGNSGTGMRLAMGLLAGIAGSHHLGGDSSLSSRPMDRVAIPLELMGASISGNGDRRLPPLEVVGGPLVGIDYEIPVASAQVKSAILLAALSASGPTTVHEPVRTRPHTEEMIAEAGGSIHVVDGPAGRSVTCSPSSIAPRRWVVPSDPSQAAFFVVAGALVRSGEVRVGGLYADATRIGFLDVLERMGARLELERDADGNLGVTSLPSSLHGTEVRSDEIPSVDEVPILAIAAAAAAGETRFVDVGELRIKESDRFARTIELVEAVGAGAHGEGDDIVIEGIGSARGFRAFAFEATEDHRMAMSAAVAGAVGSGAAIGGFSTVESSFPGFLDVLGSLR